MKLKLNLLSASFIALGLFSVNNLALAETAGASTTEMNKLEMSLQSKERSDADKQRDIASKPADLIKFVDLKEGLKIVDVWTSSGYNAELFSYVVGTKGKVIAQNDDFVYKFTKKEALDARLAKLTNVEKMDVNIKDWKFEKTSIDRFFTNDNFHDVYNNSEAAANLLVSKAHEALKNDGSFIVIDHYGDNAQDNVKLHRIEKQKVIDVFKKNGFKLAEESDMYRDNTDDHKKIVFELKGKTDRFMLKFVKDSK